MTLQFEGEVDAAALSHALLTALEGPAPAQPGVEPDGACRRVLRPLSLGGRDLDATDRYKRCHHRARHYAAVGVHGGGLHRYAEPRKLNVGPRRPSIRPRPEPLGPISPYPTCWPRP